MTFSPWILTGLVVALIYAAVNLHQSKAKDTTTVNQYLDGKKPKINNTRDQYLRKNVVTSGADRHSYAGFFVLRRKERRRETVVEKFSMG